MNKNDQQFMAQKIRAQYMEKQYTELDSLRELDAKVKRPANVFAYIFGSISAIIMGSGMSLIMTEIAEKGANRSGTSRTESSGNIAPQAVCRRNLSDQSTAAKNA